MFARYAMPGERQAEERRLFYVAVTRAKDRLWLCCPKIRRTTGGDPQYCSPSLFVEEIAPSKLTTERPVTPAPAWSGREWNY